jgi:hypothetical protein
MDQIQSVFQSLTIVKQNIFFVLRTNLYWLMWRLLLPANFSAKPSKLILIDIHQQLIALKLFDIIL